MKKLRSLMVGLSIGATCGAFAWVAQAPRPWSEENPPPTLRSPRASVSAPLVKSRSLEDFAVPRREADVLPLVASRVSPDKLPVEDLTSASEDEFRLSPPLPPEFGLDEEFDNGEAPPLAGESPLAWPLPVALLAQMKELEPQAGCGLWAKETRAHLERLAGIPDLGEQRAATTLQRLEDLAAEAKTLASQFTGADDRTRLAAAGYALSRRVAVWRAVHELAGRPEALTVPVAASPADMLPRLDAVDAVLGQGQRAHDWRRYLLMGQTRLLAEAGTTVDFDHRRRHAQRALRRMEWSGLTAAQRRFLTQAPFQAVGEELRAWAAEPFDFSHILATLEDYEREPSIPAARRIADWRRRLSWADHRRVADLAHRLDEHYRNANVRVAVSQDLLQLLAPQAETTFASVRDTIVGAAVNGQSQTTSHVLLRTVPDNRRLRFVVEAQGDVLTDTRSSKSGAVFYSSGQAWFRAQKEIAFDGMRLAMTPAVAEARVRDDLREVSTDFDNVPLVNLVAQSLAKQGHADSRQAARREAEHKVASRAAAQLDAEAGQRLADWEARLAGRVGQPLHKLSLVAAPIELQTTATRLIGRYRLAGDHQLGGHTARPQAPADSLLSVQVHDSAANNALAQLSLADRELDLPSLFREVLDAIGAESATVPDDLPPNVQVRFDEQEPVRVDLLDGRARVTLRLASLKTDGHTWRNILTRAYYRPEAAGLSARLVRDGHIELTADHLRLRDQVALRAIFAKVFAERRALNLMPERAVQSGKLKGYEVTQLVVRDGWLGLAVGPQRVVRGREATKR